MRRASAAFLTAALLTLAAAPAGAQGFGPHDPGPGDGARPIHHMARELGLTDTQRTAIETITRTYMNGALGEALRAARMARETLGRTIHDVEANDEAVTQAASAVAVLEPAIAVQRHHMFTEISALLTDEQKIKLEALMENRKDRRHARPHRGPGGF